MKPIALALSVLAGLAPSVAVGADQGDDDYAIRVVLQHYIDGVRQGDPEEMRKAFHDDATIFGWFNPNPRETTNFQLVSGSIEALYDLTESLGPAPTLKADIARIDVTGSAANARVELRDWLGIDYTDFLNLLKTEQGWKVTSKVFNQPREPHRVGVASQSNTLTQPVTDAPAVAADETFDDTWPFKARYTDAPGFKMHYVDEGEGDDTLLLLHGEPTWGYLFRHQIPTWSKHARVVAPDHMGFGKSAAPNDRTYWLQDHIDNIEAIVLALDLKNITLVMHDFGGPVGMGLAARHPDRIKAIISVNGPTPFGQDDLAERVTANVAVSPWFQWILQAEEEGALEEVLGHLDYNILSTLKLNGFVNNQIITETWLSAYSAPFPTPEHAAGAIGWAKGYAIGAHKFETPTAIAKAAILEKPALAIWGEQDRTLHAEHFLPLFTQLFPNAPVHRLSGAGHYSPEDAPGEISRIVIDFLNAD